VGILTNKDNDPSSGKELENMLDRFDIELDDYDVDVDKEDTLSEKRKAKKEEEKDSFK